MSDIDIDKVDEAYIENLLKLFRLEEEDLELIRQAGERVLPTVEELIDGLYNHILSFPELAAVFPDEQSKLMVRAAQKKHLSKILSGTIDQEIIREGLRVGTVHKALGIEPFWYLGGYARYVELLLEKNSKETSDIPKDQDIGMCQALVKVILLDVALAWEAYYHQGEQKLMDSYKLLETDHNLALAMIIQRDKEIEELLKARESHPGSWPER